MYRLRMEQFLLSLDSHFDDLFYNREFQSAATNDNLNNNNVASK